jgi:hypothetical protein
MMSMASTYFGTNLTKNMYNVEREMEQGVSLGQLAVGVGSTTSLSCESVYFILYIYIYIYTSICIYIYIYIYMQKYGFAKIYINPTSL